MTAIASQAGRDDEHTFVIPAYGRSPYLEACLDSLRQQVSRSRIVISTSTPYSGIDELAARYRAELYVHGPNRGIGHDWNMALAQSDSTWTTLAHQDDLYHAQYSKQVVAAGRAVEGALIVFTDYSEIGDEIAPGHSLLRLKRVLLELAFAGRNAIVSPAAKKRALRFGSPIPCPSVTYHRHALSAFRFREDFRVSLDWAAWLDLACTPGAFVWLREILMGHRIHAASETFSGLCDGARRNEDFEILSRIWPTPVASLILASYRLAYTPRR